MSEDSVFQGNSAVIFVTIENNDKLPLNLGGMTSAVFSLKRSEYDSEVLIEKTLEDGITVENVLAGKISVELEPGDTDGFVGPYVYEIKLIVDGKEWTVLEDILVIMLGVTE